MRCQQSHRVLPTHHPADELSNEETQGQQGCVHVCMYAASGIENAEDMRTRRTADKTSHPALAKSLCFVKNDRCGPGEMPRAGKGKKMNVPLNNVRKPGHPL